MNVDDMAAIAYLLRHHNNILAITASKLLCCDALGSVQSLLGVALSGWPERTYFPSLCNMASEATSKAIGSTDVYNEEFGFALMIPQRPEALSFPQSFAF